jgi:ATPase subunit of ABC transporter with duplicated ATPase domains
LDTAQAGLSQASRRVLQLEERKGQLDALRLRRLDLQRKLDALRDRRQLAFIDLETQRQSRLTSRQVVATELNQLLAPQIRVRVVPGERLEAYTSALVAALRGSGLHYNTLAPALASAVAPFELVDWVERSSVENLASASGLSAERAASVISALREGDTAAIIASDFDDSVELELLDGVDYKPVEHLSIGQRCTVVLPILMALRGGPLIVDQPEDHLDNAFIASTLISAIENRKSQNQTIFSSHNANIPVLGNADRVIVMESDGDSGRVDASSSLEDSAIVSAISDIMEGGAEAFRKRSAFYGRSGIAS